jgi:hypothetical protein
MIGRAILVGVAAMAVGIAALPGASVAAGKHGAKNRLEGRSNPNDSALGPYIDYPRQTHLFSSSSERYYSGGQVNSIPFRSPAEAFEIVPGLAVGR